MRTITRHIVQALLLGSLLLSLTNAVAEVSLNKAVEQAKQRRGGQVISAETRTRDGQRVHNIRILTKDGKVHRVRINADGGGNRNGSRR
ncbi:MAG: PepSY domain-containing protein [Candidatus Thiodiazotropha sp. L084R]